jgi:hypothetical protein
MRDVNMRKYVKPELFFESFEMSQQIAACDFDLVEGTNTDLSCQFIGTNELLFGVISKIFQSGCGRDDSQVVDIAGCYHNSLLSPYGIFNS